MTERHLIESKQVSWQVDNITVYGTLTAPKDEAAFCGVVLVAGSGPTDRDWCSPLLPGANGSGKLLAELLAQNGFATLRYDKRASGPHVKENINKMMGKVSMQSHLDELSGAVKTLIDEGQARENCVFALTSSEGAIHALNYQLHSKTRPLKGLVLTGAPGRAIGMVARSQILAQVEELPNGTDIIENYDRAVADFANGKPMQLDESLPLGVRQLLMSLETPVNLPFTRQLWTYDTAETLDKIKNPVLVVIGKKDIQTDWQADGKALENAAVNKTNIEFVYPENANHVLKHEETLRGQLTAQATLLYNAPNKEIDKQAADAIVNWLKKHA